MISLNVCRAACALAVAVLFGSASIAAESGKSSTATPVSSRTSTSARSGKGPLPDPVLLDGSTQPAEKKAETGMIGDFELPGDENVRNGKVGGPQGPQGQKGNGPQISVSTPMPALPIPGASGGAGGESGGGLNLPDPTKQGASAAQGGAGTNPMNSNPGTSAQGGAPNGDAKAEGMQVGQLSGDGSAQDAAGGAADGKPSPVAIGDKAMRIDASPNAPDVVGAQQQQIAGQTQQHEKGTGSGGKGSGGSQSGNRAEKGRVIPSGL